MSTTTDKATAFAYSGVAKQRGTVLEIAAGRVDNGASISFLSQYPGEAEFLMPPLSCLEVVRPPLLRPRSGPRGAPRAPKQRARRTPRAGGGGAARRPHAGGRGPLPPPLP